MDDEQIARLFDEGRDLGEHVRDDYAEADSAGRRRHGDRALGVVAAAGWEPGSTGEVLTLEA